MRLLLLTVCLAMVACSDNGTWQAQGPPEAEPPDSADRRLVVKQAQTWMITPGLPRVKVTVLKDLPDGLEEGDLPRYEVRIDGTDTVCWPWKSSVGVIE